MGTSAALEEAVARNQGFFREWMDFLCCDVIFI